MTVPYDTVFLFDVDNTLLDNDVVIADLRAHIEHQFGAATARRYWHHCQGHYALDPAAAAAYPAADIAIERIGDLLSIDIRELLGPKDPALASQKTP